MKNIYFAILPLLLLGCRKPYEPPAVSASGNYLVVEGVINPGSDQTIIKLSRTVKLDSSTTINPERGALVSVVSDQNAVIPLTEADSGKYISPGLNLDPGHKYGLQIKTADNKQYYSDPESVITTPPIDSIGFNIVSSNAKTGIQIYVNTHGPAAGPLYYLWNYEEEWLFYTKYVSNYISENGGLLDRQPNQNVTFCYTGTKSSVITLGSSAKLSQNVISEGPILFIPSTSEKIEDRYSILLREYALSADAYKFYTDLKKNTENLGSIFDAQPSSVPGNLHCRTNPSEPVIGYVSVSTVTQKRVYIDKTQLPQWIPNYPYQCQQDTAGGSTGITIQDLIDSPDKYVATTPITKNSQIIGYLYTTRECADCTIRGVVTPPPYWKAK